MDAPTKQHKRSSKLKHSRRVAHQREQRRKKVEAVQHAMSQVRKTKNGDVHKQDISKFVRLMEEQNYVPDGRGGWRPRHKDRPKRMPSS